MAQENKGAQRIHKAIVEFVNKYQDPIYQYAVTSITAPEDELPPNKQHKVKYTKRNHFSENERLFGTLEKTQYMQVWVFDIYSGQVEPEDPFPLKNILKAFDKGVSHCSSCYSYTVGREQSVFPGVIIEYGPNGGNNVLFKSVRHVDPEQVAGTDPQTLHALAERLGKSPVLILLGRRELGRDEYAFSPFYERTQKLFGRSHAVNCCGVPVEKPELYRLVKRTLEDLGVLLFAEYHRTAVHAGAPRPCAYKNVFHDTSS